MSRLHRSDRGCGRLIAAFDPGCVRSAGDGRGGAGRTGRSGGLVLP